jgi:hypothetical protein
MVCIPGLSGLYIFLFVTIFVSPVVPQAGWLLFAYSSSECMFKPLGGIFGVLGANCKIY